MLCVRFDQPNHLAELRVLRLPKVDIRSVVILVNLVAQTISGDLHRVGIQVLRVERPSDMTAFYDSIQWVRNMVPDFLFTSIYSTAGTTYNLLSLPTAHSQFN